MKYEIRQRSTDIVVLSPTIKWECFTFRDDKTPQKAKEAVLRYIMDQEAKDE